MSRGEEVSSKVNKIVVGVGGGCGLLRMLTLKQLSAKLAATPNLEEKDKGSGVSTASSGGGGEESQHDEEWETYLDKVRRDARADVLLYLKQQFQDKAKDGGGGRAVEFLRKLFVRTHVLSKSYDNSERGTQSALLLFRSMFKLAEARWSFPSHVVDDMMATTMNVVRDFSSAILSTYVFEYALNDMKSPVKSVLGSRWIELFVRFISVLNERGDIPLENDLVKGSKFREHIVEEICRMDWTKDIVKSYFTVFEEIPGLEASDVDTMLDKFAKSLKTMKMQPSLIHSTVGQVVSIAGTLRPGILLQTFDKYFSSLKEIRQSSAQKVSLGIVACGFVDAARDCEPLLREVDKRVKASVFEHTLVMTPFMLTTVLTMTHVDYLKTSITEHLRTTIMKTFHEIRLCDASLWYKDTVGDTRNNVTDCFKAVLEEGSRALDYMSEGIKELGLNLLGCGSGNFQGKYPLTFPPCRELGSYLISAVVANNKEQLGFLQKELLRTDSRAHVDCLANCIGKCSRLLAQREFHGRLIELLQHLPSMTVQSVSPIIKALMPSLQIAPTLLDNLMMILRKSFWKTSEAGRICVEIMCVMLSNTYLLGNSQIMNVFGSSDDDLIYSQLVQGSSRNNAADYSALCNELLTLAKNFFLLDCRVREQLYLGLHRVARHNPKVNDIIAGVLFAHGSQYIDPDNEECPINFAKLFEFKPSSECKVVIKDELGFFVQSLGFVYNKSYPAIDQFQANSAISHFKNCHEMLVEFINFATKVDKDELEVMASSIIGESGMLTDDVVRYITSVVFNQALQILEATMEFMALSPDWPDAKQKIQRVYRRYEDIMKHTKEPKAAKKGKNEKGKKKKKAGNKKNTSVAGTQDDDDDKSVTSAGTAVSGKRRKVEQPLKPPPHFYLINMDSVCQMLREIYGSGNNSRSSLPCSEEFEMMLLMTVKEKIAKLKAKESIRERQRAPVDSLNSLTCLVETIWKRLLSTAEEPFSSDSDQTQTVGDLSETVQPRLEIIVGVLQLFYEDGHRSRILSFNQYDAKKQDVVQEKVAFLAMFKQWRKVLAFVSTQTGGETCVPLMFDLLSPCCKTVGDITTVTKVRDWCWNYMNRNQWNSTTSSKLVESALNTFLICDAKCSKYPSGSGQDVYALAKSARLVFGHVHEDDEEMNSEERELWVLTLETAPAWYCCLTSYLEGKVSMVNTILCRVKAHRLYLGDERSSEIREQCFKMIESILVSIIPLLACHFPHGSCGNSILHLVIQVYSLLASLTDHLLDINKYVTTKVSISSFKKLLGKLGVDFANQLENMIQYIEQSSSEKKTSGKGAVKSREATLIPNLVYHREKFQQLIIVLSKKVKENLYKNMKLSSSRDFRLKEAVKEQLEESNASAADTSGPDISTSTTTSNRPGTSKAKGAGRAKPGQKRKKT